MSCRRCKERDKIDPLAMQRAIEEILRRVEIDDYFDSHENCTIKLDPPRPRSLVIRKIRERVVVLEDDTSELIRSIREPSGPHAEFEIQDDGTWVIAFLRGEYERRGEKSIEYIDGCRVVRPLRQRRHQKFAAKWSENLLIRRYTASILRYAREG